MGASITLAVFNYNLYSKPSWEIILMCIIGLGATVASCVVLYQEHLKEKMAGEEIKEWDYHLDDIRPIGALPAKLKPGAIVRQFVNNFIKSKARLILRGITWLLIFTQTLFLFIAEIGNSICPRR